MQVALPIGKNDFQGRSWQVVSIGISKGTLPSKSIRLQSDRTGDNGGDGHPMFDVTRQSHFLTANLQINMSGRLKRIADNEQSDFRGLGQCE